MSIAGTRDHKLLSRWIGFHELEFMNSIMPRKIVYFEKKKLILIPKFNVNFRFQYLQLILQGLSVKKFHVMLFLWKIGRFANHFFLKLDYPEWDWKKSRFRYKSSRCPFRLDLRNISWKKLLQGVFQSLRTNNGLRNWTFQSKGRWLARKVRKFEKYNCKLLCPRILTQWHCL